MQPLRTLSLRAETLVDGWGYMVIDPTDRSVLGWEPIPPAAKLIYALKTNAQSGITRRYAPSHPPGESCLFGCDFSAVIPLGVGIQSGILEIFTNTVPPQPGLPDFTVGPVEVRDRALYATLSGGILGTDYQLFWEATDTDGFVWPRVGLLLVSRTS